VRIKETCSCGASIEVEAASALAEKYMEKWRGEHKHQFRSYGYPNISYSGGAVLGPAGHNFTITNGGDNPPLSSVS
jgi:hypothetical protein